MINTKLTRKAMIIAYEAHKNQVDKSGVPYIYHPIHVAEQMDTENECIIALLHDVVEDTNVTFKQLEEVFSKEKCKFNANFHLALLSRYPVNTLFAYIY